MAKVKVEYEVKCNNCDFIGNENDLKFVEIICKEVKSIDRSFDVVCPNCNTSNYLMDL